MYGDSGYGLLAVASACTAAGAVFNAIGFARAQLRGPASRPSSTADAGPDVSTSDRQSSKPRENAASRSWRE